MLGIGFKASVAVINKSDCYSILFKLMGEDQRGAIAACTEVPSVVANGVGERGKRGKRG